MTGTTVKPTDQSRGTDTSASAPINIHCCVVELAGLGVLIKGPSGSGKTSLALGLVDAFRRDNRTAMLVADDQAFVKKSNEQLIATCPTAIAGKAELRGFGIVDYPCKPQTDIGLVIQLQREPLIERMPQRQTTTIEGVSLPLLKVPQQHEAQGIRIVSAWIDIWSFKFAERHSKQ